MVAAFSGCGKPDVQNDCIALQRLKPSQSFSASDRNPSQSHCHLQMTAQRRLSQIAAARGVGLLRWLLVLMIAFDQIGSPLHRHHHDSGVDAAHLALHSTGSPSFSPHVLCTFDTQDSAFRAAAGSRLGK